MPEKSGMDVVSCCCANAGDENRAAAALVTMMTVRMMVYQSFTNSRGSRESSGQNLILALLECFAKRELLNLP
jgi:hypothetical protein